MARVRRARKLILLLLLGLGGCRHVAPYQRGALARPDMTTDALASPAERHLEAVREGALPSGAVAPTGCGCN